MVDVMRRSRVFRRLNCTMTHKPASSSIPPQRALDIVAPLAVFRRHQSFSLGLVTLRKNFHVDILVPCHPTT